MRTIAIMLIAALAGCGADRVLESGRYLCATDADCRYGWRCLESPDLHAKVCYAPDLTPPPQTDAGVHDALAPTDAVAGWSGVGVRWTGLQLVRPTSIAPIANLQLPSYFADATITVLLMARPAAGGGIELRGGSGQKLAAVPLTYSFTEDMRPAVVHASVEGAHLFATDAAFDWGFVFLPSQPPLDVRHATLSGTLDGSLPTSADFAGTYVGCVTASSVNSLYIEVLGQSLGALITTNGGTLDCDTSASGGGGVDGYVLELRWESTEIVTLVDAPTGG